MTDLTMNKLNDKENGQSKLVPGIVKPFKIMKLGTFQTFDLKMNQNYKIVTYLSQL